MSTTHFKSHFLQNISHAVANGRCRSKWQIYDTERYVKTFWRFLCNKLSHSCNLKCSLFNSFGNNTEVLAFNLFKCTFNNTRTAYADIYNTFTLAFAKERTRHKRIILNRVAEYNKLCTRKSLCIGSKFSRSLNNLTHLFNSVHIDTGSCRTHINAWTYKICCGKCFRNWLNKYSLTVRIIFMHKCRITAYKVYACLFSGFVKSFCDFNTFFNSRFFQCVHQSSYRSYRNSLVDNRNTELSLNVLTGFYKVFCVSCDFFIHFFANCINVRTGTAF